MTEWQQKANGFCENVSWSVSWCSTFSCTDPAYEQTWHPKMSAAWTTAVRVLVDPIVRSNAKCSHPHSKCCGSFDVKEQFPSVSTTSGWVNDSGWFIRNHHNDFEGQKTDVKSIPSSDDDLSIAWPLQIYPFIHRPCAGNLKADPMIWNSPTLPLFLKIFPANCHRCKFHQTTWNQELPTTGDRWIPLVFYTMMKFLVHLTQCMIYVCAVSV